MKESIRILVIGDEGVGKSSLISTFVSEQFPEEVPHMITDTVLPPEFTWNSVTSTISDSSSLLGDREVLYHKIIASDAIIALYDVSKLVTLDNLIKEWLPLINRFSNEEKPIIVVGNKIDLLSDAPNPIEKEKAESLFEKFRNVMCCLRCSSATRTEVDDVFYHVSLHVTCPLAPLFDMSTKDLKPKCKRAFSWIFRVLDRDCDNLLDDHELLEFQSKCFEPTVVSEDIRYFKKTIGMIDEGCIYQSKVTLYGFLSYIKREVQALRLDVPWAILRTFNFSDDLDLKIPSNLLLTTPLLPDQYHEISSHGLEFLNQIVSTYQGLVRKEFPSSVFSDQESSIGDNTISKDSSITERNLQSLLTSTNKPTTSNVSSNPRCRNFLSHLPVVSWESELDRFHWLIMKEIFSVMDPDTVNPWWNPPIFEDLPEQGRFRHVLFFPGMNLLFGENMRCNIDSWILHWHMLAMFRPSLTKSLLYSLGFFDQGLDTGIVPSLPRSDPLFFQQKETKNVVKAMVLGTSTSCRQTVLARISGMMESRSYPSKKVGSASSNSSNVAESEEETKTRMESTAVRNQLAGKYNMVANSEMSSGSVWTSSCLASRSSSFGASNSPRNSIGSTQSSQSMGLTSPSVPSLSSSSSSSALSGSSAILVVSSIPEDITGDWIEFHAKSSDIAVICVDIHDRKSLDWALNIEKDLPDYLPRLYLTEGYDYDNSFGKSKKGLVEREREREDSERSTYQILQDYLAENDLPELLNLQESVEKNLESTRKRFTSFGGNNSNHSINHVEDLSQFHSVLGTIVDVALSPNRGIPKLFRKSTSGLLSPVLISAFVAVPSISFGLAYFYGFNALRDWKSPTLSLLLSSISPFLGNIWSYFDGLQGFVAKYISGTSKFIIPILSRLISHLRSSIGIPFRLLPKK